MHEAIYVILIPTCLTGLKSARNCVISSFYLQGKSQSGSPHMSRKFDGPAGMTAGAHLPSAALLHEAKLGELIIKINWKLNSHSNIVTQYNTPREGS